MWRVRFLKQAWLTTWLSHKFQPRGNWTASCPILSCNALAGMTLQLLACLARVQLLVACSRESPARSSCESLFFLHTLKHFFTLSHSLSLQESHLNTGLLIVEIQANLARNKANKMVDKIQPYRTSFCYWKIKDWSVCRSERKGWKEACWVERENALHGRKGGFDKGCGSSSPHLYHELISTSQRDL